MTGNNSRARYFNFRSAFEFIGSCGYTIVELLVVLAIAAIATTAIYKFFPANQKISMVQDQIAEMQQQLRASMAVMSREVKMAGYDPRKACDNVFSKAEAGQISFTLDSDSDGDCTDDPNDNITYFVEACCKDDCTGACKDNCTGSCKMCLKRSTTSSTQTIAENVEAAGFAYAFDDDGDGQLDKDPSGSGVMWAIDSNSDSSLDQNLDTNHDGEVDNNDVTTQEPMTSTVTFDKIRAVKIWILIHTNRADKDYSNSNTFVVANQRIAANDNCRRRLITTTIHLRNLGL